MDDTKQQALAGLLVGLVPPNGAAIGNQSILKIVDDRGIEPVKVIQLDVTIGGSDRRPGGLTP